MSLHVNLGRLAVGPLMLILAAGGAPRSDPWVEAGAALERFEALAGVERRRGDLPRLSDPAAGDALRTIWAAAGLDPDPGGYAPDLKPGRDDVIIASMVKGTVASHELHVLETYLRFPAQPRPWRDFTMADAVPTDLDPVLVRFGPEVARSPAASIVAVADMSAVYGQARLVRPGDPGLDGREQTRAGAARGIGRAREPSLRVAGLARSVLGRPALGAEAAAITAALATHATDFAAILSPGDRASIAASLGAVELPEGPARRDLERFVERLRQVPCGAPCGLP